jgi:hypothetical protein
MALARQQAELRGEDISVIDLAAGRVRGRPLADVLAGAAAMGDRQDAAEAWRRERGEAERVECFVSDPVIHHPTARSEHAVTMRRLYRRFTESRQANRVAAEKRRRLDAELLPLQETVTLSRPAPDPVAPPWEATRSDTSEDIRIRYGGPVTGIW